MKKVTLALALLGTLTLGFAEQGTSIDAQIEAIKAAPAQERVQLMNAFKTKLATMNEADRNEAISKLQTKAQTQTQTRTRMQEMQMQQNKDMMNTQNMNQNQAAKQYMQSGSKGSAVNNKMKGR